MGKLKTLQNNLQDPHQILGMHKVITRNKKHQKVTVHCEGAKKVEVYDLNKHTRKYPLQRTEEEDVFEGMMGRTQKSFRYGVRAWNEAGEVWTYIDPYQFESSFSKEEELLFCQGKDYHIYHKLGANKWQKEGVEGILFSVWAPHAKAVSVIGDFNFWDGRRHMMRRLQTSGLWEIFIPQLTESVCYKFEITTQDDVLLYKADPYAKYTEQRPHTASKFWWHEDYAWNDTSWLAMREKKQWHRSAMSIYEVHIGSWKKHPSGDFYSYREMADALLPYIEEMGYTHIEVLGVLEHPYDGSWGYQVTGYFAPTSRYGTPDDFKYFIDTMHQHHIGVLLDWVPAHFPKDAFGLEKFDGTCLYEHFDPKQAEHPEWGTLIFDYGKPQVKQFLISSALSWLEQYHIDGLRVDAVASMLYLNYAREEGQYRHNQYGGCENLEAVTFIKDLNTAVYGAVKGIMMIAEESTSWDGVTRPVSQGGLGFGFKWNMGWMNDFLAYMKTDPLFRKYEHNKITFSLMYAFNENFVLPLSHDEVVHGKSPMLYKMPGDFWQKHANLRLAYGYLFTHPGKKLMFMGNEFAQTSEWSESRELDWHLMAAKSHQDMRRYIQDLNKLYRRYKCLWQLDSSYEGFEWIDCDNQEQSIVSFIRKSTHVLDQLVIVVNFTPVVRHNFKIGVPYSGVYEEIFNSDAPIYGGSNVLNGLCSTSNEPFKQYGQSMAITVPPLGISVFKWKQQHTRSVSIKRMK